MVTLMGRRLCGANGDCATAAGQVQLLESQVVKANVVSYSDTRADIVIPDIAAPGTTRIVVTVNERASNTLDFEVLP